MPIGSASGLGSRQPALVREIDLGSGAQAVLVIDALVRGRSTGGLRVLRGGSPVDAKVLARAMSWKFALARIPMGGAKAMLTMPAEADARFREHALGALAAEVRDIVTASTWTPAPDIGLSADSAARFIELASGGKRRPPPSWWTSGPSTAHSAAAGALWGLRKQHKGRRGATVALIGTGKVGMPLGRLLLRHGARILAVANEQGAWYRRGGMSWAGLVERGPPEADGTPISLADVIRLRVDVLALAGPDLLLDSAIAPTVGASVITSAANVPATPEAEATLADRRVLLLPASICSWGGVLSGMADRVRLPSPARSALIEAATRFALSSMWRRTAASEGLPNIAAETANQAEQRIRWMSQAHSDDAN
jgi:glutamate dehydrogenase/leucine dehydrogenase